LPDGTIRFTELDELVNNISVEEKKERRIRKKILGAFLKEQKRLLELDNTADDHALDMTLTSLSKDVMSSDGKFMMNHVAPSLSTQLNQLYPPYE